MFSALSLIRPIYRFDSGSNCGAKSSFRICEKPITALKGAFKS